MRHDLADIVVVVFGPVDRSVMDDVGNHGRTYIHVTHEQRLSILTADSHSQRGVGLIDLVRLRRALESNGSWWAFETGVHAVYTANNKTLTVGGSTVTLRGHAIKSLQLAITNLEEYAQGLNHLEEYTKTKKRMEAGRCG